MLKRNLKILGSSSSPGPHTDGIAVANIALCIASNAAGRAVKPPDPSLSPPIERTPCEFRHQTLSRYTHVTDVWLPDLRHFAVGNLTTPANDRQKTDIIALADVALPVFNASQGRAKLHRNSISHVNSRRKTIRPCSKIIYERSDEVDAAEIVANSTSDMNHRFILAAIGIINDNRSSLDTPDWLTG